MGKSIYETLVESENDMIGHIAYSLYKSNKIKFIENYKSEHESEFPDKVALSSFHAATLTTIPALRIQAEQILRSFTEFTLNESIEDIKEEILSEHKVHLKDIIQPLIPEKTKGPWDGFWMSVVVKFVQNLIFAIALFLLIFGASATKDFWGTMRKIIPPAKTESNILSK